MIQVVSVRGLPANVPYITYCGRASHGWKQSILYNPFPMKKESERKQVIDEFRFYLWRKIKHRSGPEWDMLVSLAAMDAMGEVIKLGCWCHPKACHCDVIKSAIAWVQNELKDNPDFQITVQTGGVVTKGV